MNRVFVVDGEVHVLKGCNEQGATVKGTAVFEHTLYPAGKEVTLQRNGFLFSFDCTDEELPDLEQRLDEWGKQGIAALMGGLEPEDPADPADPADTETAGGEGDKQPDAEITIPPATPETPAAGQPTGGVTKIGG